MNDRTGTHTARSKDFGRDETTMETKSLTVGSSPHAESLKSGRLPVAPPPPGPVRTPTVLRAWLAEARARGLSDPGGEAALAGLERAIHDFLEPEQVFVRSAASGSGALALALLTIGPEVLRSGPVLVSALLPPYVAGVVEALGGSVVPVDAGWPDFVPGPEDLAAATRTAAPARPAAIVTGTGLGLAPDLAGTLAFAAESGCLVIEDAAASLGATDPFGHPAGTQAHFGVFSMAWGKSLSTGEGGLLVTPSRALFRELDRIAPRPLPGFLERPRAHAPLGALAGRLSSPEAALATALLADLPLRIRRRRDVARRIGEAVRLWQGSLDLEIRAFSQEDAAGTSLCAVRFSTKEAACRAATRADAVHLDFPALPSCSDPETRPENLLSPGPATPRALDSHARVRLLPWWDSSLASEAEVSRLLGAFAYTLTGR